MLQSSAINKTLSFYSACKKKSKAKMDKNFKEIKKDGSIVTEILKKFETLTGYKFNWCDMNAINNNAGDPKILAKALAYLSIEYFVDTLVSPSVDVNPKRDSRFASNFSLNFGQSGLTFLKPYYQPGVWEKFTYPTIKKNMLQLFKDYANLVGIECKLGVLEYHIENAIEFEHNLAMNFSATDDELRNNSREINPMEIGEIPYQFLDWKIYVSEISNLTGVNFIDESEIEKYWIMMSEPKKMEELEKYLTKVGMDTVVKYLYYRLLLSQVDDLVYENDKYIPLQKFETSNFGGGQKRKNGNINKFDEDDDPFMSKFGDKDSEAAEIRCTSFTMSYFSYANSRIFTETLYPTSAARTAFKK
uniref:Peptidase M13 N-terminal domain-containing protein n=1 Tax=Panagrolaimus superbus TaxID=310955 RepID=A0A914Z5S1_9BILA